MPDAEPNIKSDFIEYFHFEVKLMNAACSLNRLGNGIFQKGWGNVVAIYVVNNTLMPLLWFFVF